MNIDGVKPTDAEISRRTDEFIKEKYGPILERIKNDSKFFEKLISDSINTKSGELL
eukprot:Pgem_evm1s7439